MSFTFGTPKSVTGFTLPTTAAPAMASSTQAGFQFASGASGDVNKTTPQNKLGGMSLLAAPGTQGLGFSLTSTPAKTTSAPSFSFSSTPTTATAFALGTPAISATPQFNLNTSVASTAASTTSAPLSFGLGPTTSVSQTGFNAGSATSTTTGIQLGTSTAAPITSLAFKLPAPTTASLTFGAAPILTSASTSTAPALSFGLATSTASITTSVPGTSSTATTSVLSALPQSATLTFAQLEDAINKWTIDLEEQGKLFFNQARQLNAWDRLLLNNGEKILNLNNGVDRVKQQQQQLDQALDFILSQQKELEDLIVPLESELADLPVTDQDRSRMYQLAENMDSQLKQMSEDLKEIIEHLNESNKTEEASDPVIQIGRILNAHMNSLQWIDRNTAQISTHLDQILKMRDMNRRNASFNF